MGKKQKRIIGHSVVLSGIIKENNFKKFAEIGVWKGGTTKRILRSTSLEEYWGVDPWLVMPDGSKVQKKRKQWQWDGYHLYCCNLMCYFPQLKILRMTSELATSLFPDSYFDMVYLDARHECKDVYEDIGFWLPKVREGGILAGHDYGGKWTGVIEAVHEWFGMDELKIWEEDEVWVYRV